MPKHSPDRRALSPLVPVLLAATIAGGGVTLPAAPAMADDAREREQCRTNCLLTTRGVSDPRYRSCVARNCGDPAGTPTQRRQPRAAAQPQAPAVVTDVWRFDSHPFLGPSAHVQLEEGIVAVACVPGGDVAVRVTNGLFRGPDLTYFSDMGGAAVSISRDPGAVFSEASGAACDLGWPAFGTGGALVIVDGRVERAAPGSVTIGHAGGSTVVSSGSEALGRLNGRIVPLEGAASALAQMAAGCPAAQRAMHEGCAR